MRRLIRVGSLDGVALYLHWGTFAAAALALLLAPWRPVMTDPLPLHCTVTSLSFSVTLPA